MLRIPGYDLPDGTSAYEVITWVNNRLILMMETLLYEYKEYMWEYYGDRITCIDLDGDDGELENFAVFMADDYSPASVRGIDAIRDFMCLYLLLKDEKEMIPSLTQEYMLAHIIDRFIDRAERNFMKPVVKIPEKLRNVFIKEIEAMPELYSEPDEEWEIPIEVIVNRYEDLNEYFGSCFWDWDFELLNYTSEEDLEGSEIDEWFGITSDKLKEESAALLEGHRCMQIPEEKPWSEKHLMEMHMIDGGDESEADEEGTVDDEKTE